MHMTISKKIGKRTYHFKVNGTNLYEVVTESQKLSFNDVDICGMCKQDNLILNAREAKGYKYTEIKCLNKDCGATLTFGRKKEDEDTFFLRRREDKQYDWKKYEKPATAPMKESVARADGSVPDSQVPF